ncbi:hypothetical protein [Candidatus Albibeggiatoa sp. nov. NOAA]|uniref:RCC1 domain-containing protein n=1 Tax=Candidatus Albibeggiatoa sp. nov. NOAA TaxID=3162724 RepID=UPI0032FC0CC9|nr:hypothetical protein [Thiotrichaceae bacterium]
MSIQFSTIKQNAQNIALAVLISLGVSFSAQADFIGWGYQSEGQVADTPTNEKFVDFANRYKTGVGLREDGSIVAWGYDDYGQVSDIPTGTGYTDVGAAYYYTGFAINASGAIEGWGDDDYGEISDIPEGNNFIQVVGGYYAAFALDSDGRIYGWGYEDSGQLSDIPEETGFTKITTWYAQGYALTANGSIVAWGYDAYGQVSDAPSGTGYQDVVAANHNGIALAADGSIVAWGEGDYGMLDVPEGNDFVQISATDYTGYALRSDGSIVAWGDDSYGEISGVPTDSIYSAIYGGYYSGYAALVEKEIKISSASTSIEEGSGTTFDVVLNRPPSATVTIILTANDSISLDSNTLEFTSENWDTTQTVTLIAPDNETRGDQTGTIAFNTSSSDSGYNGITATINESATNTMNIAISDNDFTIPPPQPDYYMLSVAGSLAHIKSSPSGIDCVYGEGTCTKMFDRGEKVILELVDIKTAEGFTQADYDIQWFGNSDCLDQVVTMHDTVSCAIRVYGKPGINYSNSSTTTANTLAFLNFSGNGMLDGGAEDVILGFILEGTGSANITLHADAIDEGVLPQFDLNQLLVDEQNTLYGQLLEQQQNSQSFTFDKTVEAGAYTIQLSSNGVKGRGLAGISLTTNDLNLTNLSVRGHLQQQLVLNFILEGDGVQKIQISNHILQGEVEIQMTLMNLATGQSISGDGGLANDTTLDVGSGVYAVIIDTLSGEGIGMVEVDLVQ